MTVARDVRGMPGGSERRVLDESHPPERKSPDLGAVSLVCIPCFPGVPARWTPPHWWPPLAVGCLVFVFP
ncbi:MAG TPA: hypothetical protein VFY89_06830 [Ktedonobacterales bacterium]